MAGHCNSARPANNKNQGPGKRSGGLTTFILTSIKHASPARAPSVFAEKRCSVMPVTERPTGSAMLGLLQRASVMKMIFVVMVLAFAFTTGMAVTTIIAQTAS
jgi:hypothetical protein